MHPFSAMITASGAITFTASDGTSHTIARQNPRYNEAKKLLKDAASNDSVAFRDKQAHAVRELVKIAQPIQAVMHDSGGKITVREGVVYYKDDQGETTLHNVVADRIVWMLNEGFDAKPMLLFLENLMDNPSYRSVADLFRFMEKNQMGITPDGCILAYKKIREDYTDIYTSTLNNRPGEVLKMRRNEVEDNPNKVCSDGLHVCGYNYLPEFGSKENRATDRIVVVKVQPKDVVSVPVDYNDAKMRVCEYVVLYEVERKPDDILGKAPVSDADGGFSNVDDDKCPKCGADDYDGYCDKCGYEKPEPVAAGECPNCGDDDGAFEFFGDGRYECSHCHYSSQDDSAPSATEPRWDMPPHEWPLAGIEHGTRKEAELRGAVDGGVDLRKAVERMGEAAAGLYGDDAKVGVEMALAGDGLSVTITPQVEPKTVGPKAVDPTRRGEILQTVTDIVILHLGVDPEKAHCEARLVSDLGADSLDVVELCMAFEEEFKIEVPDEEGEKLLDASINELVAYIVEKVS